MFLVSSQILVPVQETETVSSVTLLLTLNLHKHSAALTAEEVISAQVLKRPRGA